MAQWFSSFYWRNYTPSLYSKSKKEKILESFGNTCGLPNCNSKLKMKNGQFLHIKQLDDYNQDDGEGLVVCNDCFDKIREKTKLGWMMLTE